MEIGPGVTVEDQLIDRLIGCGRDAHDIARAHDNDPGSNGHTFGLDRYQRGTELAKAPLEAHGFDVRRRGAGLRARRGDLELQFAVARGDDLNDPADFDADSSPARRRAGHTNSAQLVFEGMPELEPAKVVHVVWSGTVADGLTSVHMGRLVSDSSDSAVEALTWAVLLRVDRGTGLAGATATGTDPTPVNTFLDQPEPTLALEPKTAPQSDEA